MTYQQFMDLSIETTSPKENNVPMAKCCSPSDGIQGIFGVTKRLRMM